MTTLPYLFDTHAHLDFPKLSEEMDAILERATEAGVDRIVTIGASRGLDSNYRALSIARAHPDRIRATAGIHPHDASVCDDQVFATIRDEFSRLPEVVAIGETGLDYYYDKAPQEKQRTVFRRFLELAIEVDKPVIIHSREAEEDTVRLLEESGCRKGIIHCFTGSKEMAFQCLDLGFHISFSGIVTFKNGRDLLEIASQIPVERLLVETDSPYLAPTPKRGKSNEPSYVRYTAEKIAEARGLSLDELATMTTKNASELYQWPLPR